MVVAILANYGPFLHSDGQLSELSDHIASRTCHRIEFDHDVNESVDTRGNIIPAIPSNASPDEEAQKEIRKFLVDFSKSPDVVVAKKRHHTESRVTIPLSRLQSQISGNILSKGKKAKLHNDETINKQIVEAALGVSQAEPTNPTSSNKFGSFSGKFTSSLTEKSTQLENKLDTNVGKFLTLSLTSMPEGEPKKINRPVGLST
ncbi:hypothetical protein PCANC_07342 [Puccinia coronata f. sp. avenae]|uniref:Uncharacterized protein n=1 Tax=Puccinia coronata f. sp. avenae TaxID=200324 RepID=A0A2N5T6D7_9BASI|nr:hypothetical protein PCANC_07342 [Puccinia coronata f. sp. avenae]PLW28549.1 hypothetical protein PCASD_18179 [Puccinia coronata f. sp. avenae]